MLKVDLFNNINNNDVLSLLSCLGIKTRNFKKGSNIISAGQKNNCLIILLSGKAKTIKQNILGEEETLSELKTNDIFGQDFVCLGEFKSPVNLVAVQDCEILFIDYDKIMTPCSKLCPYHLKAIRNIVRMIAQKNSILNTKINVTGQKFIRKKIMTYLKQASKGKEIFEIPLNRQKMADFLSVERCSLSRELSKMQKDKLLNFKKNKFKINF